jgi:predicted dehydrogenase
MNFDAKTADFGEPLKHGYKVAIISLPDHISYKHTMSILDHDWTRIMIEKPGALNSGELQLLINKAKERKIPLSINYQRSFDTTIAALMKTINEKSKDGFSLDYASIYNCDNGQPP